MIDRHSKSFVSTSTRFSRELPFLLRSCRSKLKAPTHLAAAPSLSFAILLLTASAYAIVPQHLRIDSLNNPIGLESKTPEFSWTLRASDPQVRSTFQTAYRIVVASSRSLLYNGKPDIWDSGRVAAYGFIHIPFAGQPLMSHTTYFWRVRVWDQSGVASKWSDAATWTTALLSPSDWSAKWIAAEPDGPAPPPATDDTSKSADTNDPLPIFRHDFKIGKPVKQALVFVSGLGQYELTLNGEEVTKSILNPGWTNYSKTVLYQTYDVTNRIHLGRNALAVMLGNGMYNVPGLKGRYTKFVGSFGQPKLILQMHVSFTDNTSAVITTDKSWKTTAGPIVFSSTYGGEDYDARKEPAGWLLPGFDDSAWSNAIEVSRPGDRSSISAAALSGNIIPSMAVIETLTPVKTSNPKPGVTVYDFGRNISGWPRIAITGHAGDIIKLTPSELLDEHGLASQASANAGKDDPVLFTYTLKGTGRAEVWSPRFTYYGFRYIQAEISFGQTDLAKKTGLRSITAEVIHDDVTRTGSFVSELPLFNRIHHLIDSAVLNNLASVLTDCPTREKLGWLEQTHLMGTSIMENFDVNRLYQKMANDMADSQLSSGLVPAIAPEFIPFLNSDGSNTAFRDSPEWGSAAILSPWTAYQFYGDKTLLSRHFATMTRYAAFLKNKSTGHILQYGLGDWYDIGPKEPGESQLTSKGLTATAIYYQDLTVLTQIGKLLNKPADAQAFSAEAATLKEAFNRHFFHPETNQYDLGSQTANAMPLVLGLVPEDRRPAVLANLIADIRSHGNHVTAGDIGFHYVVRALTDGGRSDVLCDMLGRTDSPSYGFQLSRGATTLTEAWDASPTNSQDHFMLGHAEEWFYRGLAGIDIDMSRQPPQQIVIRPAMLKLARGARASVETVLGTIRSSWTFTDTWNLDVEIPTGASATVYLPGAIRGITESSKPIASRDYLKEPMEKNGDTVLVVGSGVYRFHGGSQREAYKDLPASK